MSASDDYQVPVKDGSAIHPRHSAPEEMYWLSHLERSELTEKYVGLHDNFYTLKKFSCKQEDKIKKLQTKLRKMISDRKEEGVGGQGVRSIKELEFEDALERQRHALRELRARNQNLEKKLKLASVQLSTARKNKPLLFRHIGARVDSGLKHSRAPISPHVRPLPRPHSSPHIQSSTPSDEAIIQASIPHTIDEVPPVRVRQILEEARERILALEEERDDLQEQLSEKHQSVEAAEYELQTSVAELEEEVSGLRGELQEHGQREEREALSVVRTGREVRTLAARCTALTEQLAATEEKVAAESGAKAELHADMERTTARLLSTEAQAREGQAENLKVSARLQQVTEKMKVLEKENSQLQHENEHLISFNLSGEQRELSSENQSLQVQVAQLEAALQSDLSERGTFLEQLTQDKEAVAGLEREVMVLMARNLSLKEELEKVTLKMEVYKKAGLLDAPEKDLTASLQKDKGATTVSTKEFESLREAHSDLQLLYREKTQQLETLTNTLTSHSHTYKALEAQVARVTQDSEERERELSATIRELHETVQRRDDRCEQLQALVLATGRTGDQWADHQGHGQRNLGRDLTRTLDLGRHDNMLEFHIAGVTFEAVDLGRLKTFVSWTVPFALEDPLQHTNVAVGSPARYAHSALYTFHMTHRNLESLRQDPVSVSVYLLLDSGHPAKVGECRLSFCEVLERPRNILHGTAPITLTLDHPDDTQHFTPAAHMLPGQVIGTLSYWFRLQRPYEDVIAQHLRSVRLVAAHEKEQEQGHKMMKSSPPVNPKRVLSEEVERRDRESSSRGRVLTEEVERGDRESSSSRGREQEEGTKSNSRSREQQEESSSSIGREQQEESSSSRGREQQEQSRSSSRGREQQEESRSSSRGNELRDSRRRETPKDEEQENIVSPSPSVPAPRSHAHPLSPSINLQASPKRPDQTTRDQKIVTQSQIKISPDSVSSDQGGSEIKSESIKDIALPHKHFRSNSVTSTGTYNIGSPQGQRSNDSGDDTETESCKSAKVKKSTSKSISGGIQPSVSDHEAHSPVVNKRAVRPKSAAPPRVKRGPGSFKGEEHKHQSDEVSVYVEVVCLTLGSAATTALAEDPLVDLLFVDYHGFLGLPPDRLETPLSLPKPTYPNTRLDFNFGQELSVDPERHPERWAALGELMRGRGLLKFTLTSEPPGYLQDTHDCHDLGYVYVDLHHLFKSGHDLEEEQLPVESTEDGNHLGTLTLTIRITRALTQLSCA